MTVLALLAQAVFLTAQDYERLSPQRPPILEAPGEIIAEPSVPLDATGSASEPLLAELLGLVLVAQPAAIREEGLPTTRGLHIAPDLICKNDSALSDRLVPFLHQPLTLASLDRIVAEIVDYYRQKGRPVVDAIIPPQDITGGTVQVIVLEGQVGEVRVEGAHWFPAQQIRDGLRLKRGDPIETRRILADLDWLNANPFRQVDLIYARGSELGVTDLTLRNRERFPLRFYTGYEDTGSDTTGDERWIAGYHWGNAFNLGHLLSYQFTTSSDLQMVTAHSASYQVPLPWRHRLTVYGSYAQSQADLAAPFNLKGKSWQTSARYAVPLPTYDRWKHEATAGFDFKQSNNNLDFGGTTIFANDIDIAQWNFGYNGSWADDWGSTTFSSDLYYGPGGWAEHAKDRFYQAARAGAEAEYLYGQLRLFRQTNIPLGFQLNQEFVYQLADTNLLSSEQFGAGGRDTVRGYDEREINGDEGWRLRHELRLPALHPLQNLWTKLNDELVFLGFWDYGVTMNKKLLANENPDLEISGAGAGLRYRLNTYLSVQSDYGFQLLDSGFNNRYDSRWHLSVLLSY